MAAISNINDFIRPLNSNSGNAHTSLKGIAVTPFTQSYHKAESRGFDLNEILENPDLLSQFNKYAFPRVEKTSTGNTFITPIKRVVSSYENYCIKWLVLDKDLKPVHNHDYPMVPLPQNGFLMKVVVPITSETLNDFVIEYIADYHNIQVQIEKSIDGVTQVQSQVIDGQSSIQIDQNNKMMVLFDINQYPEILKLIVNKEEFFKQYLHDISDNL